MLGIEICHEDIKDDYRANVMPINSGVAISKIDQKLNMEPPKTEYGTRKQKARIQHTPLFMGATKGDSMSGKASRDKGKRFELSLAHLFEEHGYDAHRSAQFCGKTGQAADVIGVPGIHVEAKFQERMMLYDWMAQAVRDSSAQGKGNLPAVFHKQSRKDLLVTMRFDDWMKLYKAWDVKNIPFAEEDDGK